MLVNDMFCVFVQFVIVGKVVFWLFVMFKVIVVLGVVGEVWFILFMNIVGWFDIVEWICMLMCFMNGILVLVVQVIGRVGLFVNVDVVFGVRMLCVVCEMFCYVYWCSVFGEGDGVCSCIVQVLDGWLVMFF